MRGRKPNATARKILDGNPGGRPLNEDEPAPPVLIAPLPPEALTDPVSVAEWLRLYPMLVACRQITEADRSALIAACIEWGRYLKAIRKAEAEGEIKTAPSGYPIQNPQIPIATKALAACVKLWAELGLTPSSRSRVQTSGPPPGGDDFSEFDEPNAPAPAKH